MNPITTPIINGEKPFIVNEISTDWLSKDMCKYYGPSTAAGDNLGICTAKPAIITKRGLYNIGDTIKCTK